MPNLAETLANAARATQTRLTSYLLWRSTVEPNPQLLAKRRITASIALLPAAMAGVFTFGWWAAVLLLTSVTMALAVDVVCHRYVFKDSDDHRDGIWMLSGVLLALLLPPNAPLWVPLLGAAAAVFLGKYYVSVERVSLLQPAALGLLVIAIVAWKPMNPTGHWPTLTRGEAVSLSAEDLRKRGLGRLLRDFFGGDVRRSVSRHEHRQARANGEEAYVDAGKQVTAQAIHEPRPLELIRENPSRDITRPETAGGPSYSPLQLILGYVPGPIGSSSGLALLLGILLLVFSRSISPFLPLFALLTMGAALYFVSWITQDRVNAGNIPVHLLSGSTLLSVFYLAADPGTAPRSTLGKIYAGVLFGLVEVFLRVGLGLSEGVIFTVIIVQMLAVLIDERLAPPAEDRSAPSVGLTPSSLGRL